MKIHHFLIGAVLLVLLFMAYHRLQFFGLCPGEKTISKKTATNRAKYIAKVASVAIANETASNGASLTSPTALPLADTWSSNEKHAATA